MKSIVITFGAVLLFGCQKQSAPDEVLSAPGGGYKISVFKNDLGSCCSSTIRATLHSNGGDFGELDEQMLEVKGAVGTKILWLTPYHVQIKVCNAKDISYRSDFSSLDFSKHIHINVVNLLPDRSEGKVICQEIEK